ncbi:MAG: response regulator [Promethearchaeota archaeon]
MKTIFIVEDDFSLQKLYQLILDSSGYHIIGVAYDGQEAINAYRSFLVKPDVILMDHRMPIKDGIDTTKELLKIENSLKIIFISADKTIREMALSAGAKIFMKKPFIIDKLVKNIKKVLNL